IRALTPSTSGETIMSGFNTPLKLVGGAALATLMLALPVLAQDAEVAEEAVAAVVGGEANVHTQYILNSFLMLFGGILVFWMAAGFAMLEAGVVRPRDVSIRLLRQSTIYSLACLAYYVIGYPIMYPGDGWLIGGIFGAVGIAVLEP